MQKVNYIHRNAVRAELVSRATEFVDQCSYLGKVDLWMMSRYWWGAAPKFRKSSDGGAKPPPHIGRQSRAAIERFLSGGIKLHKLVSC